MRALRAVIDAGQRAYVEPRGSSGSGADDAMRCCLSAALCCEAREQRALRAERRQRRGTAETRARDACLRDAALWLLLSRYALRAYSALLLRVAICLRERAHAAVICHARWRYDAYFAFFAMKIDTPLLRGANTAR